VEYGVALDVAALAQQLLQASTGGDQASQSTTIVADPRSNAVLVRASTPERLKLARDLIRRIDSPESRAGNLHVVYLRNAQATHLAEVLRGALTGQGGSGASATGDSMLDSTLDGGGNTSPLQGAFASNASTSGTGASATGSLGGSMPDFREGNQQAVAFSA